MLISSGILFSHWLRRTSSPVALAMRRLNLPPFLCAAPLIPYQAQPVAKFSMKEPCLKSIFPHWDGYEGTVAYLSTEPKSS